MDMDREKNPAELAHLMVGGLRIKVSGVQTDRARARISSGKGVILLAFETRS
jgi:hypothetical protein